MAFVIWEIQGNTRQLHGETSIREVGRLRRLQILEDEFPAEVDELLRSSWLCKDDVSDSKTIGVGRRRAKEPAASLSDFLRAYSCTWDGKHYHWLGEFGYRPNITVHVALSGGPLGLRFSSEDPNERGAVGRSMFISAFARSAQEPLTPLVAEALGRLSIGDELLALNGNSDAELNLTRKIEWRLGHHQQRSMVQVRPSEVRWFDAKAAFMPLYPLGVLRPTIYLFRAVGANADICLLGVSLVACALSAASLAVSKSTGKLLRTYHISGPERCAFWLVDWLVVVWPSAFFLTTAYSESLYSLLAALWISALLRKNRFLASFVGVLLPLARGVGAFSVFPAAVYACQEVWPLVKMRFASSPSSHIAPLSPLIREVVACAGVVASPVLGYLIHGCLMLNLTGEASASKEAQRSFVAGFSAVNMLRPQEVLHLLAIDRQNFHWHQPTNSILDRGHLALAVALLFWGFRRLPTFIWVFSLVNLLVPPFCGSLMSFTRFFITGAFPLLWACGGVPRKRNNHAASCLLQVGVFCGCIVAQAALIWRFLVMEWAG